MDQLVGFLLHPPLSEIGKKIGKMLKCTPTFKVLSAPLSGYDGFYGECHYGSFQNQVLVPPLHTVRNKTTVLTIIKVKMTQNNNFTSI